MNKVKWWLRIVGGLYLLLGIVIILGVIIEPEENATFWGPNVTTSGLAVVFALVVLGILMLSSSRNPENALSLVKIVALLELFAWIPCDAILVANGLPVIGGVVYICIHLIIGLSGLAIIKKGAPEENNTLGNAE